MISWVHQFFSGLTYTVSIHHPQGLFILLLLGILTEIGVPLMFTLEIFLLLASYYLGPLSIEVLLIVLVLLTGREIGATLLYQLSRILGVPFLNWLQRHFPSLIRGVEQIRLRANQHTTLMVVLVRLTPGLLQFPSVFSGSLHLRYRSFFSGVAISALIYDFSVVFFGFIARIAFKNVPGNLKDYFVIAFAIVILIAWIVVFKYRHHFESKNRQGKRP